MLPHKNYMKAIEMKRTVETSDDIIFLGSCAIVIVIVIDIDIGAGAYIHCCVVHFPCRSNSVFCSSVALLTCVSLLWTYSTLHVECP